MSVIEEIFGKDANVISVYTNEQAIEDGIKMRLGPRLFITTNCALQLAQQNTAEDTEAIDLSVLHEQIKGLLERYNAGQYCDPGASDYPEEADASFAYYLIGEIKVWAIQDGDGLTLLLPEDY